MQSQAPRHRLPSHQLSPPPSPSPLPFPLPRLLPLTHAAPPQGTLPSSPSRGRPAPAGRRATTSRRQWPPPTSEPRGHRWPPSRCGRQLRRPGQAAERGRRAVGGRERRRGTKQRRSRRRSGRTHWHGACTWEGGRREQGSRWGGWRQIGEREVRGE